MTLKALLSAGSIAAMFVFAGVALAQPPEGRPEGRRDPQQMVDRQVAAMKDHLKLTDDQATKVKPILLDSMKSMMEIREKFGPPQQGERPSEEMMTAMKKNREETTKKLGEVLSKEQMADYEKMLRERRGGPGGPGGPGGRRPPQQ